MPAVHPVDRAWISTGGTGAQNYDEFADEAEITAVTAANPRSALAVEMPHRAPDSQSRSFTESLPLAVHRLAEAKEQGAYRRCDHVVAAYRISEEDGRACHGLFAMVDTAEISTSAAEPGRVIRNEDVFPEKVREREALLEATGHLLSPVLLLQTGPAAELDAAIAAVCRSGEEPSVVDIDQVGRRHEVWPVTEEPAVQRLCDLAGAGELVVADGNHRTLAAQEAGLDRFLAVITTPASVDLRPYHRLLAEWPDRLPPLPDALAAAGAKVEELVGPAGVPATAGTIHLLVAGRGYAVQLPVPESAAGVDRLDHAVVEQVLLRQVLGWDPGDKRIRYVGGDYPPAWLREQVDTGSAAVAVLIAPVVVDDFVTVNLNREKMPRKSTWFTPKARAGLVVAELAG